MSYALLQDAIDIYGETFVLASITATTLDDDDVATPDTIALDNAFAKASSEMDSYLGVQYDTPISPVPDILERYCVDMGIYLASVDAGTGTDEKRLRYDDALKWLRAVAKGDAVLVGADAPEEEHLPEISGPTRAFSRSKMGSL